MPGPATTSSRGRVIIISGGTAGVDETPSGSRPGTVFTTSTAYTEIKVWLNGVRQKLVVSAPNLGEFTYSGTTLTMGTTVQVGDWLTVTGFASTVPTEEDVPGTGTTFTLVHTYTQPHVMLNGVRQQVVGVPPALGQAEVAGTTLTMGISIVAGDWLHVEEAA